MIVTAVLLSSAVRFLRFTQTGGVHPPDFVSGIKNRYRFWDAPKGPGDFDFAAGVRFTSGIFRDTPIGTLQIYSNGVHVQGQADTGLLDGLVDDLLSWFEEEFKAKYEPVTPVEKLFLSALEVRTVKDVAAQFDWLSDLSKRLSEMIGRYGVVSDPYRVTSIALHTDSTLAQPLTPRFVFERRANIPYSENLFYSEAPVSTEEHIALLETLELSL